MQICVCVIILFNLHNGHEMNRAKNKKMLQKHFYFSFEVGNSYFISDVYKVKTFAVF